MVKFKRWEINTDTSFANLLDQNEVAEMLNVSPKTLEYWRWKKKGPQFFKLGRLVRYYQQDIFRYLQELIGEVPVTNSVQEK
jgi:predicted DNA-binding transcriptional regulator AlpA